VSSTSGTLLDDLGQEGVASHLDALGDLAERRFGGVGVVEVVQRAQEQPRGSSEQDAQRAAEDPDQQADEASARGALEAVVAGLVLQVDATVLVAGHDGGPHEVDLSITVELLDGRERLVGLAVVGERDDDDLVGADGVGIGMASGSNVNPESVMGNSSCRGRGATRFRGSLRTAVGDG
jgi:hypothetical protein